MKLGIAGTDENKRISQAHAGLGIAGEIKGKTEAGAMFGISGIGTKGNISAAVGVAGPNTRPIIASANGAMGIAGNFGSATRNQATKEVVDISAFKRRDEVLSSISKESSRLGDVAARTAWLSCEPMMERLTFSSLDMFNWVVIGGASKSTQTAEFKPPREWVMHLWNQADEVSCKVYEKTNLLERRREYPW